MKLMESLHRNKKVYYLRLVLVNDLPDFLNNRLILFSSMKNVIVFLDFMSIFCHHSSHVIAAVLIINSILTDGTFR